MESFIFSRTPPPLWRAVRQNFFLNNWSRTHRHHQRKQNSAVDVKLHVSSLTCVSVPGYELYICRKSACREWVHSSAVCVCALLSQDWHKEMLVSLHSLLLFFVVVSLCILGLHSPRRNEPEFTYSLCGHCFPWRYLQTWILFSRKTASFR